MDKKSMLQAAEDEWLIAIASNDYWKTKYPDSEVISPEEFSWHWFWLILAESIWPSPTEFDGFFPVTYSQWLKERDEREESGE